MTVVRRYDGATWELVGGSPVDMMTTDTAQDVTGAKRFVLGSTYTFSAALSTYPDTALHSGIATTANGWPVSGSLTGYRNGTLGVQRLQGDANGTTYARYWTGSAWSPFVIYVDSNDLGTIQVVSNVYSNLKVDGATDDLAALNALYAAAPDGSVLVWPPGTMIISGTAAIPSGKHFIHRGAGRQKTIFVTTSGTADMFTVGDWYNDFEGISFQSLQFQVTGNQTMAGLTTLNVTAVPTLLPNAGTVKIPTVAAGGATASHAWATVTYTGRTTTTLTGCTVTVAGAALSGQGFGGAAVAASGYFRSAGYGINAGTQTNIFIRSCDFRGMYDGVFQGGTLCAILDCQFSDTIDLGIVQNGSGVNGIVHNITADCTMPAASHLNIQQCGSLVISDCDFIRATNNLLINPASTGAGVFAVYAVNSFFDSGKGSNIKFSGNGNTQRVKFSNCWMCSAVNGGHGVEFASTAVGTTFLQPTAIDFHECDIYGNAGSGINAAAANGVQDFSAIQCRIAGNVTGVNAAAATGGSNLTSVVLIGNRIGPTGGFGANTTGVAIATGTYGKVILSNNDAVGNTTALTLGTVTVANFTGYRITDNPGINPKGSVTTPGFPTSTTVVTNSTGFRCLVRVSGGTASVYTINGVATGLAAAGSYLFTVEPGGTIAITFTVAPTWTWIGQ